MLAREKEDWGGGGGYKSNAKFGIAIYLVPVLYALIVGIKRLKALESLPFYTCTILKFEKKNLLKNAENIISEGVDLADFPGEHAPRSPRSLRIWRLRHWPRLL